MWMEIHYSQVTCKIQKIFHYCAQERTSKKVSMITLYKQCNTMITLYTHSTLIVESISIVLPETREEKTVHFLSREEVAVLSSELLQSY